MANVTIPLLGEAHDRYVGARAWTGWTYVWRVCLFLPPGNYAGRPRKIVSLLEGITNAVQAPGNVTFAQVALVGGGRRTGRSRMQESPLRLFLALPPLPPLRC